MAHSQSPSPHTHTHTQDSQMRTCPSNSTTLPFWSDHFFSHGQISRWICKRLEFCLFFLIRKFLKSLMLESIARFEIGPRWTGMFSLRATWKPSGFASNPKWIFTLLGPPLLCALHVGFVNLMVKILIILWVTLDLGNSLRRFEPCNAV